MVLTIGRLLSVIPLVILLYIDARWAWWSFLVLFSVSMLSDLFDGWVARRYRMTSTLGALLDPVADKVVINGVLVMFVASGDLWSWVLIVFIARDFTVDGWRLAAVSKGVTLPADVFGKIKTVVQILLVYALIFNIGILIHSTALVAVVASLFSLIRYMSRDIHSA